MEPNDTIIVGDDPPSTQDPSTNIVIEDEKQEEGNHYQKRKRVKTTKVWMEFEEVEFEGVNKLKCKWCKRMLAIIPGGSTTHLLRHIKCCTQRQVAQKKQKLLTVNTFSKEPMDEPMTNVSNFVYDYAKVREAAAHMVLIHEYSFNHMEYEMFNIFMRTNTPHWQKISRTTSKHDCVSTYELEKKKLKTLFKSMNRISITTDLWKSGQEIEYMVVTGHFVANWKLQKRILNFIHVPPPCTGVVLSDALYNCFLGWGIEDKVATITMDNASANDLAIRILEDNFALKKKLFFGGKIFHVRCTTHIINLLVQDGLKEIQPIIENVWRSVKYLSSSEARLIKFREISKQLQLPSRKLILDCATRWNSTYAMLVTALEFKEVFPRYRDKDSNYLFLPTPEDWDKVDSICQLLGVFNEVTKIVSGSDCPTSNLFLIEIGRVYEVLKEKTLDGRSYIRAMTWKMMEKFNKYWGECNLLMSMAAVLDPRFKQKVLIYYIKDNLEDEGFSYSIIIDALYELFHEYVSTHNSTPQSSTSEVVGACSSRTTSSTCVGNVITGKSKFLSFLMSCDNVQPEKSDLDVYLEEGVYRADSSVDAHFCVLEWWKVNRLKFNILSKMACDILSIPISTVASESAFSAGGRVIDAYCASLSTETVQVLMCGADWARYLRGIKRTHKVGSDGIKEVDLPL